MTRHDISPVQLRQRILAQDATWYAKATTTLHALPPNPTAKQFASLWGGIKYVYIDLQGSKCIYCETFIEGSISNDVEHFRPKAKVISWKPPASFLTSGLAASGYATPKGHAGYRDLAYNPWNYAASCKQCNSVLKKNYFPIAGQRRSTSNNPRKMKGEKAFFIYPIGDCDDDPRDLIRFVGMHPEPVAAPPTHEHFRALVTIEVFKLNNADEREGLFRARALILRELYSELENQRTAATAAARKDADEWITILLDARGPHSSCLSCFAELYNQDRARAEQQISDAKYFLQTGSIR